MRSASVLFEWHNGCIQQGAVDKAGIKSRRFRNYANNKEKLRWRKSGRLRLGKLGRRKPRGQQERRLQSL
jgi:hypothetical protein